MNAKHFAIVLIGTICLLAQVSCGTKDNGKIPEQTSVRGPRPATNAELLAPGDTVKLVFPGAADYNQVQRIRADGMLSLPVLGEVSAGGKRFGSFQKELTQ